MDLGLQAYGFVTVSLYDTLGPDTAGTFSLPFIAQTLRGSVSLWDSR